MSDNVISNSPGPLDPSQVDQAAEHDPDDAGFTRRGFVKIALCGVGLAYALAVGYPIYRYLNSPVEKSILEAAVKDVTLPNADKLPKGSALVFKFGVRPALLIHHSDDTWVALSAVCTHMGCTVAYNPATARIECHCHGGIYNAHTGENIEGPPPRPLAKFDASINEGSVTVRRI